MRKFLKNTAPAFWFLVIGFAGCTHPTAVRSLKPMEVQGMLNNDFAVLVDVREENEIADGMAARAKWLPTSKLNTDPAALDQFLKSIPKDKEIVLYCRSGHRAGNVANLIAAKGYKTANMGGFSDWVSAGLPTEKPQAPQK